VADMGTDKTPLVSNFINTVFARGRVACSPPTAAHPSPTVPSWVNYIVDENGRAWSGSIGPDRSRDRTHDDGVGEWLCDGHLGR